MARQAVYLDHNASAPLLPAAREALLAALEMTGNPSSVHGHGRALRAMVDKARKQVAELAGAEREQVVFTSSATEAITQAITAGAAGLGVDAIVISAGEHAAVTKAAEATGLPVRKVGLSADGVIRVDQVAAAVSEASAAGLKLLVAVHLVNNETGVIQPVDQIEVLVGPTPHYLFVDAVQGFGKLALDFAGRAPDMVAVSAHKIGGPTGVGALLMKNHISNVRLIPGGGQETGRRGGTEPAALIAAFGAAAKAFPGAFAAAKTDDLVEGIERGMRSVAPDLVIFGAGVERIGNTSNFAVPGLSNAVAMVGLDLAGLSVSSGSACSSGKVGASHVLGAMGVPSALGEAALRVSFGWSSTRDDAEAFLKGFSEIVTRHRARHGVAA